MNNIRHGRSLIRPLILAIVITTSHSSASAHNSRRQSARQVILLSSAHVRNRCQRDTSAGGLFRDFLQGAALANGGKQRTAILTTASTDNRLATNTNIGTEHNNYTNQKTKSEQRHTRLPPVRPRAVWVWLVLRVPSGCPGVGVVRDHRVAQQDRLQAHLQTAAAEVRDLYTANMLDMTD
jgi:hypothetical protein